MRRVTIDKQTFLVEFFWEQTAWKTHREILQEARSRLEYDRYVYAPPYWGSIDSDGQKGKRYALAPLLIVPSESHVSVYALTDADTNQSFWWVLGYRNGSISVRSDKCFERETDALLFAESLKDTLGLESMVEQFDSEQSLAAIQSALAEGKKAILKRAQAHLSRDVTPARILAIVAGVVMVLGLIYGANELLNYRDRQQRLAAAQSYKLKQEKQLQDASQHPEKIFPSLWMSAPSPEDFITAVVPELFKQPLSANGWKMKKASGNGKSIRLDWEATPLAEYLQLPFDAKLDPKNMALAHSSISMASVAPGSRTQNDLLPLDEALQQFYAFCQHFGIKSKISWRKRIERTIAKQKVSCPWVSSTLELLDVPSYMIFNYTAFAKALNISGLIVNELLYTDGKWNLKGELYAR